MTAKELMDIKTQEYWDWYKEQGVIDIQLIYVNTDNSKWK